jgi:hypothetical protein
MQAKQENKPTVVEVSKEEYLALSKSQLQIIYNYLGSKPYVEVKDIIPMFDNLRDVRFEPIQNSDKEQKK